MPRKLKVPPRFFALNSSASAYLVIAYNDDFFDVVYYRQYHVGEDDVEDELTAKSIHKRFAIRKRKLIDGLRVVFAEDTKSDWDADAVEVMIRMDSRVPKYPGRIEKDNEQEEDPKWAPLTGTGDAAQSRL